MLTCIPCSKQLNNGSLQHPEADDGVVATPRTKQALKALTAQVIVTASPEPNRAVSALCSFFMNKAMELIEFLFIFRSRIWH
jgi:hypothetical protein